MFERSALARRAVALVLGLALALLGAVARAEAAGLPAVIDAHGSSLEAAQIQAAVERELGVALHIDENAPERLEIVMTGRRANVTYYAPGREPVTRSVDLPREPGRALETIAFLAGNLARDEAAELLRQLAPPAAGEEVPPPPPPPPLPPPPAPPPAKPEPVKPAAAKAVTKKPAAPALIEPHPVAANLSLYYPVTILKNTEQRRLNLELGLAYSWAGAVRGAAVTLGYLRVDGPVEGFSYAFLWNRSGPVVGLHVANFVAEGHGLLKGVSYADFANVRDGEVRGVQASAIFTSVTTVRGVQGAGIAAVARDVHGVQAASIVSVAEEVHGVQAAALVNVAKRVNGLQIGLVNVAEEIHGGALGIVSVAKNGDLQPVLWMPGEGATFTAGMKSITDLTYSQLGIGYDPWTDRFRQDASAGLHLGLPYRFQFETGVGYDETRATKSDEVVRQSVRLDGRLGFEVLRGLTPFVGGSFSRRLAGRGGDYRGEYFFGLALL